MGKPQQEAVGTSREVDRFQAECELGCKADRAVIQRGQRAP